MGDMAGHVVILLMDMPVEHRDIAVRHQQLHRLRAVARRPVPLRIEIEQRTMREYDDARILVLPCEIRLEPVELRLAETHYEKAIKGLEEIATSEQDSLDPRTAATVRKSLAVIDQAISESRAAIRSQPANEPAQQSLIENFKTKITLLQDTVVLINEMRKGNEAGAARIVSGLKQKG